MRCYAAGDLIDMRATLATFPMQLTPVWDYAGRVLAILGIASYFTRIFDINFIDYESKPTLSAYHKVLSALGTRSDEGLMIDDSARNLAPAKALGMRTVLLDGKGLVAPGSPVEGVDEIITTIYDIQYVINDLQKED